MNKKGMLITHLTDCLGISTISAGQAGGGYESNSARTGKALFNDLMNDSDSLFCKATAGSYWIRCCAASKRQLLAMSG